MGTAHCLLRRTVRVRWTSLRAVHALCVRAVFVHGNGRHFTEAMTDSRRQDEPAGDRPGVSSSMSGLLSFLRRQVASYHLHSSLQPPQARGGQFSWREFGVSQVATGAQAVQPLQGAHSVLSPKAAFGILPRYFWNPQLPVPVQSLPQSLAGKNRFLCNCFGKKQGALT